MFIVVTHLKFTKTIIQLMFVYIIQIQWIVIIKDTSRTFTKHYWPKQVCHIMTLPDSLILNEDYL